MSGGFVGAFNDVELYINLAVAYGLLVIKIFAFVSCLLYSAESYVAAGKLTKPTWMAILGVGVLLQVIPINISIVNLILTVAALVYLADVRPAMAGLRRR